MGLCPVGFGLYHRPMAGDPARAGDEVVRRVKAVDGVTLEIADAEFLVLVGPSGCGKSTLLRMIAGLEDVSDGAILIGDRDVTDLAPRSRDVAMVFQTYALYPHMTVRQNLGYGLKARRTPEAGDRPPGRRRRRVARPHRPARAAPGAAVGRPAPAGRDGSRDRARAAGVPPRRAAVQPRCQAPRRHARVARPAPPTARRHDGLRDARPDGGDDARPACRRDARRQDPAGATARTSSTRGRATSSSPPSSARRR